MVGQVREAWHGAVCFRPRAGDGETGHDVRHPTFVAPSRKPRVGFVSSEAFVDEARDDGDALLPRTVKSSCAVAQARRPGSVPCSGLLVAAVLCGMMVRTTSMAGQPWPLFGCLGRSPVASSWRAVETETGRIRSGQDDRRSWRTVSPGRLRCDEIQPGPGLFISVRQRHVGRGAEDKGPGHCLEIYFIPRRILRSSIPPHRPGNVDGLVQPLII